MAWEIGGEGGEGRDILWVVVLFEVDVVVGIDKGFTEIVSAAGICVGKLFFSVDHRDDGA